MAEKELAIAVAQVHTVATAVAEIAARGTLSALHPLAVAVWVVAVFPHVHEVVLVDVALIVVGTYAGTGGNRAVDHD